MSCIAIIPARGGSRGIPRKNIRLFCGVPLIVHTIRAAQAAPTVDGVLVSTDDEEIAGVAREAGAEVVMRPAAISGDEAGSESALTHALESLSGQGAALPEVTVFLQCTAPLMRPEDIEGCVRLIREGGADSAFVAAPFHYFVWKDEGEGATGVNHDPAERLRRQDREPEFIEAGSVYAMRTGEFLKRGHRFFGKIRFHEIPSDRVVEIDDEGDWCRAEILMKMMRPEGCGAPVPSPVRALVLDFDGVLTDNRVWVDQEGRESVACWRSDGLGLSALKRERPDLAILILSKERNPVVSARAEKLGLEVIQGCDTKLETLREWAGDRGIPLESIVYVGNDVNDVECLQAVGCGVAVADAYPEAREAARLLLTSRGGHGAVREMADRILRRTDSA